MRPDSPFDPRHSGTARSRIARVITYGIIAIVTVVALNLTAKQTATVKVGIESELAKKIVKLIKDGKLKVQASIQGEAVRVSGAKKDLLQETIALVRKGDHGLPLQFQNFRD